MTDDDVTASCLQGCELHGRHLPLACCPAPCCNGCDCPTHSQVCTSCFHCAIATVQVWLWMKQWVHVFTHTQTHAPCSPGTRYLPVCVWQIGGRGLCSLCPEEMAVKTTHNVCSKAQQEFLNFLQYHVHTNSIWCIQQPSVHKTLPTT